MEVRVLTHSPHFDKESKGLVGKAMESVAFDEGFPSKSGRGVEGIEE
jgi:hypothetical protein